MNYFTDLSLVPKGAWWTDTGHCDTCRRCTQVSRTCRCGSGVPGVMGTVVDVVVRVLHRGTAPGHTRVHHWVTLTSPWHHWVTLTVTVAPLGPPLRQPLGHHWVRHWVHGQSDTWHHWVHGQSYTWHHWVNKTPNSQKFLEIQQTSQLFSEILRNSAKFSKIETPLTPLRHR